METTRQRIHTLSPSPIGNGAHSKQEEEEEKSFPFQEECKSLGLLALIMLVVFIGFQMNAKDAYSTISTITSDINMESPKPGSPSNAQIPPQTAHITNNDVQIVSNPPPLDAPIPLPNPKSISITETNNINQPEPPNFEDKPEMKSAVTPLDANGNPVTNLTSPPKKQSKGGKGGKGSKGTAKENMDNKPFGKSKTKSGPMINIRSKKTPFDDSGGAVLPSIEQMITNSSRRFYSEIDKEATIYNYDTVCPSQCNGATTRSKQIPFAIIGGLYNTGTNVAFKIISQNCQV